MSFWGSISSGFTSVANTVAGGVVGAANTVASGVVGAANVVVGGVNSFVGNVESVGKMTWEATSEEARCLGSGIESAGLKVSDSLISGVNAAKGVTEVGFEHVVSGLTEVEVFIKANMCDIFLGSGLSAVFVALAADGQEEAAVGSLSVLAATSFADKVALNTAAKALAQVVSGPVCSIPGVSASGLSKSTLETAISFMIVKACSSNPKLVIGSAGQFLAGVLIYGITKLVCEGKVPGGYQVWAGANANMFGASSSSSTTTSSPTQIGVANVGLVSAKVFDVNFYLATYPDLRAAFGNNYGAALNHWVTYGINEGRRGSREFDVGFYLSSYPDLKAAFGTNYGAAINHWLSHGIVEGRRSAREFDVGFYLTNYPDLKAAFGATNYVAAFNHWFNFGLKEGRRSSREFDVGSYLSNYSDLKAAFGTNYDAAFSHWFNYGLKEGRRSSHEFDVGYYLTHYPDLKAAFGVTNYGAAFNHWFNFGLQEGRRSSQDFDVGFYLSSYPDLKAAFGATNYGAAFNHWFNFGAKEGRKSAPA